LVPSGGGRPATIVSHHVDVVINNGFARTEVNQKFRNDDVGVLDAVYSFPVPESASLSEGTIRHGETTMDGEVMGKDEVDRIYGIEKNSGSKAGKAEKNGYQDYRFSVANVSPGEEVDVRFVYYQPLDVDTGVGRFVYPLEEGGTDDAATRFWTTNDRVTCGVSLTVTLKSAYPLAAVRSPNRAPAESEERLNEGYFRGRYEYEEGKLDRDFVFYYRLADNLPGRIEMIANRPVSDKPGTFMLVLTPGLDLKPLESGTDYLFILDQSGSMSGGKIRTLTEGVAKTLGEFRANDRFQIVTFESRAHDLTRGWIAVTPENTEKWIGKVKEICAAGGTNLYDGLKTGLRHLDADRATSVILVTDGVTNTGVVDPKKFHQLLKNYDVRLFGFLMGNSVNWPLMRTICEASGGYYTGVSNDDDIVGEIIKAKSKVTHECLRDAHVVIGGVDILDEAGDMMPGRIYRGQQLVLFGRYAKPGRATVSLRARLTGEEKTYETDFDFPEQANDNPEIDRLYAVAKIERIENLVNAGVLDADESAAIIRETGIEYQIVTDETSMLMLDDAAFVRHGVERKNRERVVTERQAKVSRDAEPQAARHRVDRERPAFQLPVPSLGGGGAFEPVGGFLILLGLGCAGAMAKSGDSRKK
jgi:Ca-activated chloride channel family protein